MPSIISTGIGSGLDITGIVQQLVAAEARPVETRLGLQEARAQSKLSAYGLLKSSLSEFRDSLDNLRKINSFLARTATTASTSPYTVTADSTAVPGSYAVEVVNLAAAQKLTSAVFSSSTAVVGTGTLNIKVASTSFNVVISSSNNTLTGIRDAINAASDNAGVSASIVNATAGSYLILTADNTGLVNTMTVTQSGGDGGLSVLQYDPPNSLNNLTQTIAPKDALIRIDGFDVKSASNSITTAIQGVTIKLVKANATVTDTLTVANDEAKARTSVNNFISSYNKLIDVYAQLDNFDSKTKVAGPLFGDSTLSGIQSQIRRELSKTVTGIDAKFSTLNEIGITIEFDGKLKLDDTKLTTAMTDEFPKLGQLFSATNGIATKLYTVTDSFLLTDGVLKAREDGLNKQIDDITDDRTSLSQRLVSLEARLLRQFNAMDSLLAQLSTTSNFLSQQLANLPGSRLPVRR